MSFYTEPTGYEKTIISDLQGAWENLRQAVVDNAGFDEWDKVLFHIDEGMSWETVRHLDRMKPTLLVIRNLASQNNAPAEVMEWLGQVYSILDKVMSEIEKGKIL
jgi:hypothetical protein